MKDFLLKNKGVIWFSLLKYVEIGVTAATTFFLAKKLGPREMGYAIPVLLYITYSNYLTLGVNQILIKNFSRFKDETAKIERFITINLQFLMAVGVVNILLAFLFLDLKYALLASFISMATFLRGFFSSYYRATYRIKVLNKNNIIFSVFLFSFVSIFVTTLQGYLFYWTICLSGALVLYFLDSRMFFVKIFRNITNLHPKKEILFNLKEGAKLAISGLLITILLTSDRFIINKMNIPIEIKGSYQLADYVGTAFYMLFTTVFFYFFPRWIERIRTDLFFRKKFIKLIRISLISIPFCLIISYYVSKLIADIFFHEYRQLEQTIMLSIYLKTSVIYLNLCSLYYIGIDRETYFIKSLRFLFISLTISASVFICFKDMNFLWIPLILGTLIFMDVFRKMFLLTRFKNSIT